MDHLDARTVFFVKDADQNELFVWLPEGEITSFEAGSRAPHE